MKVVLTALVLLFGLSINAQNEIETERLMLTIDHFEKAFDAAEPIAEDKIELSLGCDINIYLTSNYLFPGFYSAIDLIYADGTLQSGSLVLQCETEIILDMGFEVELGAELDASIDICIP